MSNSKLTGALLSAVAMVLGIGSTAAYAVPFNGHDYTFVPAVGISWTTARNAAVALGPGWDLVSSTSAPENAFVESLLGPAATAQRNHVWIGLSDAAAEGTFVWSNGDAFGFTDWWAGEPNNLGNEDYIGFDFRGATWSWNDIPVSSSSIRGYVAENSIPVPEPATLLLFGTGLGLVGLSALRRRRAKT
jgi:hypothetical protein